MGRNKTSNLEFHVNNSVHIGTVLHGNANAPLNLLAFMKIQRGAGPMVPPYDPETKL